MLVLYDMSCASDITCIFFLKINLTCYSIAAEQIFAILVYFAERKRRFRMTWIQPHIPYRLRRCKRLWQSLKLSSLLCITTSKQTMYKVIIRVGRGTSMSLDISDLKSTKDKMCTIKIIHLFIKINDLVITTHHFGFSKNM